MPVYRLNDAQRIYARCPMCEGYEWCRPNLESKNGQSFMLYSCLDCGTVVTTQNAWIAVENKETTNRSQWETL